MKEQKYDADSIQILEGLEAVRKRPSMYIGDVSNAGFHHLVWEALDNSVDEALQKRCNEIDITIFKDGSISVKDNGAGIPVDFHKKAGLSALEVILTKLHAGGKFDNKSYKVSGGLHGVGISVVNALSQWLEVEVKRNGKKFRQTFEKGLKTSEVIEIGKAENTGTTVRFKPDPDIFEVSEFNLEIIKNRVSELAYLMGHFGLKFSLKDLRNDYHEEFYYPKGIVELINDRNLGQDVLLPNPIFINKSREIDGNEYFLETCLQFNTGFNESVSTFVNNINTIEGGTHLVGFKAGLSRVFNRFAKNKNLIKEKTPSPTGEDLREGLTAILSLRIPNPKFESQTKIRLGNREVETFVSSIIFEELQVWLEENPKIGINIFNKALDASRARAAARNAREKIRRKSSMENTSLPFKLSDCHKGTVPENAELYLVEGDSAGGSAITGRAGFQAILPLRGKILNVEKAPLYKILEHKEIEAIVSAIGNGFLNEVFEVNKLRYHKVIIMTDADIDGSHIRTLLLTFFYRKMPNLIKNGFIYLACPPLYHVKIGNKFLYVHEEKELKKIIEENGLKKISLQIGNVEKKGEEIIDIYFFLNNVKKFFFENFPDPNYSISFLKHILNFNEGTFFSILNKAGDFIDKDFLQKLGFSLPIIQVEEDDLGIFLESLKRKSQGTSFSFSGENELTDVILNPIHLSRKIINSCYNLFNLFYDKRNEKFRSDIYVITKKGGPQKMSPNIFDFPKIVINEGKKDIEIKRFKGLGEMEPSQLWESTMDPNKRVLFQVNLSDAIEADRIFNVLMGSVVEPRRNFIEKHALEVLDLDI